MRIKNFSKKLNLNKITIALLGTDEMGNVNGGVFYTCACPGTGKINPPPPTLPDSICTCDFEKPVARHRISGEIPE